MYNETKDLMECTCCGATTTFIVREEVDGDGGDETCTECGYQRWWFEDGQSESNYDEIIEKLEK